MSPNPQPTRRDVLRQALTESGLAALNFDRLEQMVRAESQQAEGRHPPAESEYIRTITERIVWALRHNQSLIGVITHPDAPTAAIVGWLRLFFGAAGESARYVFRNRKCTPANGPTRVTEGLNRVFRSPTAGCVDFGPFNSASCYHEICQMLRQATEDLLLQIVWAGCAPPADPWAIAAADLDAPMPASGGECRLVECDPPISRTAPGETVAHAADVSHGVDFTWLNCSLGNFSFTKDQRVIVRLLFEDWQRGGDGVDGEYLLKEVDRESRLRDIFKNHPAWKKLIVPHGERKGVYKLGIPRK